MHQSFSLLPIALFPPSSICCPRPPSRHSSSLPCLPQPHGELQRENESEFTRHPITSSINTLLPIRYSSILPLVQTISVGQVVLNTARSTELFTPNSIHSWHPTKLYKHFTSTTFTFLLLGLSYPMSLLHTPPFVQLLLHTDTSMHLAPIFYCSGHFQHSPRCILLLLIHPVSYTISHPPQLPLATPGT